MFGWLDVRPVRVPRHHCLRSNVNKLLLLLMKFVNIHEVVNYQSLHLSLSPSICLHLSVSVELGLFSPVSKTDDPDNLHGWSFNRSHYLWCFVRQVRLIFVYFCCLCSKIRPIRACSLPLSVSQVWAAVCSHLVIPATGCTWLWCRPLSIIQHLLCFQVSKRNGSLRDHPQHRLSEYLPFLLSTCLSSEVHFSVCLPVCLQRWTYLSVCLSVFRGGVDPNQRKDVSGHAQFLLLHLWSDGPGRTCLLAERLEEAACGHVCSTLPVLRLQLVRLSQ